MIVRDEEIPTADGLSSAWLNKIWPGGDCVSLSVQPVGTGQLAETYRLTPDSGGGDGRADLPVSMVCKIASSDASSREIAASWNLYGREVNFYRQVAPRTKIDTPHIHASGLDDNGGFFLLMEDFPDARAGNQLAGTSLEDASGAMRAAAKLHAAFWGGDEEQELGWLETGRIAQPFYPAEVFCGIWPQYRDRYADMLTDRHRAFGDRFSELYEAYSRPLDRPRTVVHNDFRPDNMLFTPDRLVTIDWQSVAWGFNAVDVAYLIGGALDPEQRREWEARLLETYLGELTELGVTGYGMAELEEDYRHFTFAGIVVAVCAAMLVKRTERGDKLFLGMLDRHMHHVEDVGGLDHLQSRG